MFIDLNCDMGELEDASIEEAIMPHITSANVACGAHAGSEEIMRRTIALARRYGVAVGAHPGYPDRRNFGRVELALSPEEIAETVYNQIVTLEQVILQVTRESVTLEQATLEQAALKQATLEQATLEQATLEQATLKQATLKQATLKQATLKQAILEQAILEQVAPDRGALELVSGAGASACQPRITHVKPHGALYNVAAKNPQVAAAIAEGVARWNHATTLVGLAGSKALDIWRERGFKVASEAFADRGYEPDGSLRPRNQPGALITNPAEAAAQALTLVREGRARTLCIHSDSPGAVATVKAVARSLQAAGITLRAFA